MNEPSTLPATSETREPRSRAVRDALAVSWWAIFPLFTGLVATSVYERAVLQPQELWLWLWHRPVAALLVGAIYVTAHWWCLAWYLLAVHRTQRPIPSPRDLMDACGPYAWRLAALLTVLAVEYSPVTLWRWILR
jgi:hypothetical protein